MDLSTVLLQVEEACADLQVPSTRHAGEQVIMSFKQMSGNLDACQYILEHTQSHVVQFYMALAVKESVIRDYILYSKEYLSNLKSWILNYCLQRPNIAPYVQKQILHTISVMIKRSLDDCHEIEKQSMLIQIQELVALDGYNRQVGVALANELVDEFSTTKASSVGLPWDFHKKTKEFFEATFLLPLFEMVLRILHQRSQLYLEKQLSQSFTNGHGHTTTINNLQNDLRRDTLLAISLNLVEKILYWDFTSKNDSLLAGTFAKEGNDIIEDALFITAKTREFPVSWRSHLIHNEVLRMFFTLYKIVQQNEALAHRCRQCMIQISGLHGDIFETEQQITDYITLMIREISELMNNLSGSMHERAASHEYGQSLLGTSQMIRRLLCTFPLPTLCSVPDISTFLHEVAQLSATCLRESVMKDDSGFDDCSWSLEAFDELLAIWVKLVQDVQSYHNGQNENRSIPFHNLTAVMTFLAEASYHIVATYIDTRLEAAKFAVNDDEEEEMNGFKDWDTYGDQLLSISILARIVCQQTLEKLQTLLHERLMQLKSFFEAIADNSSSTISDHSLLYIYESLHWLILISACILADPGEGEQPLIPDPLMQLSISQDNLGKNHDQIVMLLNTVLGILDLVSLDTSVIEISHCSPRVAETLFWFFERWGKTYLLIDESNYQSISNNMIYAFGKPESHGEGMRILHFLVDKIKTNFILWNGDSDPLFQIVRLLNSYGKKSALRNGLLKSDNFSELLTFFTENLDHFPQMIHNSLIQTIAIITSGAADEEVKQSYFQMITGAIEKRFLAVLQRPDFSQVYQQADIISEVQNALEMFDGLAMASDFLNTTLIYDFCSKYFEFFVRLLQYYKNCPEVVFLVLQFFNSFVTYQDFSELSSEQTKTVYQTIVEMLKAYSEANIGKKQLIPEEQTDEPYADISILLDMLSEIMASEFRGYSFDDLRQETKTVDCDVSSVVFYGINLLIPLINLQVLKESVSRLAYQAITPLALYFHNEERKKGNALQHLGPPLDKFLQIVLECFLFKDFESELLEPASETLVSLICSRREYYNNLVQTFISNQTSPELRTRLHDAFATLSSGVPHTLPETLLRRRDVSGFREILFRFLMDVRGFLRVK
ncbi:armadillo-type protein [Gigaspora margarita]|uniref:Exportin-4 n=1 Tax=Gigaspora margarita TaxID=4874 RepID=A0A8H4AQ91_GIGMA|nr:armadillo-type protein [Gigaspora margarita]